jgi:hypothetical protein
MSTPPCIYGRTVAATAINSEAHFFGTAQLLTSFPRAAGATHEARFSLIAAFWRPAKSLRHSELMGWLVGAVGIENTTVRNFKDLEGMQGNVKELKRNNWECKGILIGPLVAPRFSRPPRFRHGVSRSLPKSRSRLRAQI